MSCPICHRTECICPICPECRHSLKCDDRVKRLEIELQTSLRISEAMIEAMQQAERELKELRDKK